MRKGLGVYIAAAALATSVSLVVSAQQGPPSAAPIRLKAATFTPAGGEQPNVPPGAGPVMDAWKAQASAAGAEFLEYIPGFAVAGAPIEPASITPSPFASVPAFPAENVIVMSR